MSKKKNFTKEQKHLIKQCIIDADIMGLGKHETIAYVKSRLGLDDNSSNNNIDPTFSEGSYKKYRAEAGGIIFNRFEGINNLYKKFRLG